MFPRADVPVLQVSIDTARSPEQHFALGRALRSLRDADTLVLGSGGATHNLALYAHARGRDDDSAPPGVGRGLQRMDGRRHCCAAVRRSLSLFRARAVTPRRIIRPPSTFCRCS